MNRVIAALHSVDYAAIGLADFGKPGNYFARQISRWTKQYQISETEKIPEMDQLIEWLPKHIPASDETSIVHGDFRLDNMIFDRTQPRVLAILDWELSTLGHPLADFSYHCMSWYIPQEQFRGIGGLDHASLGIPTASQYVAMYCKRTGRDPAHPRHAPCGLRGVVNFNAGLPVEMALPRRWPPTIHRRRFRGISILTLGKDSCSFCECFVGPLRLVARVHDRLKLGAGLATQILVDLAI